jgi:hypothetical protein
MVHGSLVPPYDGGSATLVNIDNLVKLDKWLLLAGGLKNTPSIIRATCTFDTKKVLDS